MRHRFHGMRSKNRGSRRSPDHFKRRNCSASERSEPSTESRRFHGPSSTVNPLWRAARHKDPFASIGTEGKRGREGELERREERRSRGERTKQGRGYMKENAIQARTRRGVY